MTMRESLSKKGLTCCHFSSNRIAMVIELNVHVLAKATRIIVSHRLGIAKR